jgi:hypothetical protein
MFPGAMHRQDRSSRKTLRLTRCRCLERFSMTAKPNLYDAVAAHSIVHAARDGLHLW